MLIYIAFVAGNPVSQCLAEDGEILCEDKQKCVHKDQLCDGVKDCDDGSDEGKRYCYTGKYSHKWSLYNE